MATKLTLRMDPLLIKEAKIYAKQHGKSVSQIVMDYFSLLSRVKDSREPLSLPLTKSLRGVIKGAHISEKDYKKHLENKYL